MLATSDQRTDAEGERRRSDGVVLRVAWSGSDERLAWFEAVVALFGPAASSIAYQDGPWKNASVLRHAVRMLCTRGCDLRLVFPGGALLTLSGADASATIKPGGSSTGVARVWLQADPSLASPVPILSVPLPSTTIAPDLLHGLVAVAHACGPLATADTANSGHFPSLRWSRQRDGGRALVSRAHGAVWSPGLPEDTGEIYAQGVADIEPSESLVDDLTTLLQDDSRDLARLQVRLQRELPQVHVRLTHLGVDAASFHVPAPADACLRLMPEPDTVRIELDATLPPTDAAYALAHAAAHVHLGHLRPGDTHGHWDTLQTLSGHAPLRRWDREARENVAAWAVPGAPRRTSLTECTPREKAWLVLLDHIGRMVGQTRTLHPVAERYQDAAYQRQAAQRLVAQLEEFAGAMLCDGVGLGKTYVATTVLVHYANAWRDRLAEAGRSSADDPFRITILAPNSVVSTWQREAIPPLAAHGLPSATIRVVSHTKLSRILPSSEVLQAVEDQPSDLEHLLLSDLVVVDEAHNFRSVAARRTVVLRDLLRLQPRKDLRRKVLLLTATPVNNGLEDLRQQTSLLFSKALWFNDATTVDGYRSRVFKDVEDRVHKARRGRTAEVSALLVHGSAEARFSFAVDFRDDLQFGVQVPRVGDYLKEQEKRLIVQQQATRLAMTTGQPLPTDTARIAADLLDRIVVQRSRALCKQIEREQGSDVKLLFRPDAPPPEKLVYEDVYDDTRDVLARFLPLFDTGEGAEESPVTPLSLKVYMWADIRDGVRDADEVSSVVGLQRVLVLKRLESSPVAFLITLLRLLALHAHRLKQLGDLCHHLRDTQRAKELDVEVHRLLGGLSPVARGHLDLLLTGSVSNTTGRELLERWSRAHMSARPAAGADDPPPPQLDLFGEDDQDAVERREQLERLWSLRDDLVRDLGTLLNTAPGLADIVFGRFDVDDWPRRFIAGGAEVDWPESASWGLRIVTDAKLRRLVTCLLHARADRQKVIVFSQFTDTLAYLHSVLRATAAFERQDWRLVLQSLSAEVGTPIREDDVRDLVERHAVVSGETEERDLVIHAFAPFYRLGPVPPMGPGASTEAHEALLGAWRQGWTLALRAPIDVLLATDVLAEGVNLQDAARLVNYDVHWNPVRMIQRSGRIDRRLNPAIEDATHFPHLDALAAELDVPAPRYWWHGREQAAPITVNLLLPDDLEAELQLRERIANKTLAIDFTLGLEQGTGAEADWMADYRYRGISALNVWQGDRAIERVAGYQERLRRLLSERTIDATWIHAWNGWLRESGAEADDPILAWAELGRTDGVSAEFTRHLHPALADGVPHWLWTTARPAESVLNRWLVLDGVTRPPARTRTDLPWSVDASRPVSADDVLRAAVRLVDHDLQLHERGREVGKPVQQGVAAIAAGFFGSETDRSMLRTSGFRILQLRTPAPSHPDAPPLSSIEAP